MVTRPRLPFLTLLLFIVEPFSAVSTMVRNVYIRRRSLSGRAAVHYLTDKVSSYLYPPLPSSVHFWDGDRERWYVIVLLFLLSFARFYFLLRFLILFASFALASNLSALIHTIIVVSIPHALVLSLGIVYYTKKQKMLFNEYL